MTSFTRDELVELRDLILRHQHVSMNAALFHLHAKIVVAIRRIDGQAKPHLALVTTLTNLADD